MTDKNKIYDGGQVFPCDGTRLNNGELNPSYIPGLTKREYFAAKAMQAYRTNPQWNDLSAEGMASYARYDADALILELKKGTP
jgi:hypothetical protein